MQPLPQLVDDEAVWVLVAPSSLRLKKAAVYHTSASWVDRVSPYKDALMGICE